MRSLASTLITAQKSNSRKPYLRLTFSLTGETDVVIEQDRILMPEGGETDDSQIAEIVFDNSDGYFTDLDFKGWQVVIERGLETSAGVEYDSLPALKVMSQDLTSAPLQATCIMSFIGIPNLLAKDKASAQYLHHWSDTKTVETLIAEILSQGGTLTNLTGTATGSPITLVAGTNTIIVTGDGTFTIVLPPGSFGRAISGTATVTSSPVSLVGGSQTITVSGAGVGKTITIMAVDTELTESQETSDSYYKLDDTRDGVGQLVCIQNRTVTKLAFRLKKNGNPAGTNVTFRLDSVDSGVLASKTFAIASIGTDPAWCEVTLTTPVLVNETSDPTYKCWIFCLNTAGTATDYVSVSYNSVDVKASTLAALYDPNESLITIPAGLTPVDDITQDCAYRYKYTATGIGVFSHCTAYTVTYDSEDSLIDTYAPADGFRIEKNSSRLDAINTLLQFTGCVKRVEADEAIHVFVPTTTGAVYDYQYEIPDDITIDVGSEVINRAQVYGALYTYIDLANPANDSGVLTDIEVWAAGNMTGLRVGTFYLVSDTTYKCRDSVVIGDVTAGSKQTFLTRLNVQTGDFLGCYFGPSGGVAFIEASSSGYSGVMGISGEYIDPDDSASYSLGAGDAMSLRAVRTVAHEFLAKSIRKALVDPNKITVSTFPDDDTAYSGSYTDSVSYAILPIEEFRSTKLTSDAQGTAIATAMIGQAVLAAQRGTATVPINLGAEIWDYVKVTDSRMSDSRVGNLGYIKWWYRPGQDFNMTFSFSKLAVTGIGAFRPSKRGRMGFTSEEQIQELYDNQGITAKKVDDQGDDIDYLLEKNKAKDVETSVNTQIGEKQIGLLRNIVEDLSPQLGGDLDAQSLYKILNLDDLVPHEASAHSVGSATLPWASGHFKAIRFSAICRVLITLNHLIFYIANTAETDVVALMDLVPGDVPYLSMIDHKIVSLLDPTSAQDAATKNYVDKRMAHMFTRDMTAASGDEAYSGVGFSPKSLAINGYLGGVYGFCWGMGDAALNQGCCYLTVGVTSGSTNTVAVYLMASAGAGQYAVLKSMDADGFTLTWTKLGSPTGTADLHVLAN